MRQLTEYGEQLKFLRNHDHLHESQWQFLLSYVYEYSYHVWQWQNSSISSMDADSLSLDSFEPLYVASKTVRVNSFQSNPLQE